MEWVAVPLVVLLVLLCVGFVLAVVAGMAVLTWHWGRQRISEGGPYLRRPVLWGEDGPVRHFKVWCEREYGSVPHALIGFVLGVVAVAVVLTAYAVLAIAVS